MIFFSHLFITFCSPFQLVHTFDGHSVEVHLLLPFGNHLISVDIHSNLKIWDVENGGKLNYYVIFLFLCIDFSYFTEHSGIFKW